VLEFNARFGDPEAQAILLRLDDDLAPILAAGAAGNFGVQRLHFRKEASAVVVLASAGYPEKPIVGEPIEGLDGAAAFPGVEIFHGATAVRDGRLVTAGGRVLSVGATASTLPEALRSAYGAAKAISWPAKYMRKDIGRKVIAQGMKSGESGIFRLTPDPDS
jgi:phosphoribosylamine--glycine ligase